MADYKIREGAVLVNVCGENIIATTASPLSDECKVYPVNGAGAFFWKTLEEDTSEDYVVGKAIAEYGYTEDEAHDAYHSFTKQLLDASLLFPEKK